MSYSKILLVKPSSLEPHLLNPDSLRVAELASSTLALANFTLKLIPIPRVDFSPIAPPSDRFLCWLSPAQLPSLDTLLERAGDRTTQKSYLKIFLQ
ncbi:hypothetical protein QUB47_06365 [Microcoleus sp. AT9_B5]